MPYSKQTFSYTTGARTFTLALASGYDNESNIRVYVVGELTGGGDQIYRTFTFDSEFVINVTDSLTNPSSVVVERTVSPIVFSVDFEAGSDVTKRNLQLAFRQQFFLMQEILDGRVDGVDITVEALNSATSAAESAAAAVAAAADAIAAAASAASIDVDDFVRKDGTTDFTAKQIGVAPTADLHLATKKYVDDVVGGGGSMLLDGSAQMAAAMLLVNAAPTLGNHATRKTYVDDADALKATIASPTFTGAPLSTTPAPGDDTTKIATTAFVKIASAASSSFSGQLLQVEDRKSAGVDGGTFTNGSWRTRDLNTVLTNEISGASLSSDHMVLPIGDYYIEAHAPVRSVNEHKGRLRNTTDNDTVIFGTSEKSDASDPSSARTFVCGRFSVVGAPKNFEFQHRCESSRNTDGFGLAPDFGQIEIFTQVKVWKV